MANNREQFTTEIFVNNEQARDATEQLSKKLEKQTREWERLREELGDFDKKTLKAKKAMESTQATLDTAKKGVDTYRKALDDLNGQSMSNLIKMQKQLKRELDRTKPDTKEWRKLSQEYQQVTDRIASLSKAQKGIVSESNKSSTAFGRMFKKINDFYGGLKIYAYAAKVALQAIVAVTKQVVNASQTMGDKWRNGMAAMKTTTDAFFMSLSTGDWSAFNNGLTEALKKARELAELKDLLGSFQIAGGYMQAKYRTDYTTQMTEATNTENDAETRREALRQAQADLEAQREFTEREAKATFETLQTMFEAWKGITFDSQEEFDRFFDRLFRYVTTGADEAVEEIKRLKKNMDEAQSLLNMAAWGGVVPDELLTNLTNAQNAYNQAVANASEETMALVQAAELNDERHKELIQTYAQWRSDLQRIAQDEKSYNRTRDRVLRQIGDQKDAIESVMAAIDEWAETEKRAALERYNANKASFDSIADAYREYQDELAQIDAEAEARREAERKKEEERLAAEAAKRLREQQAASDKAYNDAINRLTHAENEQINTVKRLYAGGIVSKEEYEAQKALIEEDYLRQRMATAQRYGKAADQFESLLLDRQIARMLQAKAMLQDEMDELERYAAQLQAEDEAFVQAMASRQQGNTDQSATDQFWEKIYAHAAEIRAEITEDSAKQEYENRVRWAQRLAEEEILTEEEAQKYILKAKLDYAQAAAVQLSNIQQGVSDFSSALQGYETAHLEAEYQKQLTAAGDNAEKREQIDAEYEQKKLDLSKKYADVDMGINIAKTVANGAMAVIKAFAELGPIAGAVSAVLIGATTAAEIATIIAQRNAIKNTTLNGSSSGTSTNTGTRLVSGFKHGGYTPSSASDNQVVGVAHANEWYAPAWMVRQNPVMFANLERYRQEGSGGRSLTKHGFATGGYTGPGYQPASSSTADIETIVENAIRKAMASGAIRAFLVRNDLTELDNQTARLNAQTSR